MKQDLELITGTSLVEKASFFIEKSEWLYQKQTCIVNFCISLPPIQY